MGVLAIEYLADHRDLVELIAEWHWRDDGARTPPEFWRQAHAAEAVGRDVPTAWVAFLDARPVGCVSLIAHNMDTHLELTPWLAALFVVPDVRGRGIGTALTRRCEGRAAELRHRALYLYTESAERFYARLGWERLTLEVYENEDVAVMRKALTGRRAPSDRRR
jgi:GNAT superfamily N-acetyltransferase